MTVVLSIYSDDDTIRYHDEWTSDRYFDCEAETCPRDTMNVSQVEDHVRREISLILDDDAFAPGFAAGDPTKAAAAMWSDTAYAPTVRRRIATQLWKRARGIPARGNLPEEGANELRVEEGPLFARADNVITALQAEPLFTYYPGSMSSVVLAWSAMERAIFDLSSF